VDVEGGGDGAPRYARVARSASAKRRKKKPLLKTDPNSPFAALGDHALFGAGSRGADKDGR
jgi:hypothetical protein